jgi:hypothetical protein
MEKQGVQYKENNFSYFFTYVFFHVLQILTEDLNCKISETHNPIPLGDTPHGFILNPNCPFLGTCGQDLELTKQGQLI